MKVTVTGGELPQEEINAYIARANSKYPHGTVTGINIHVDGDYFDIEYTGPRQKFRRIRRITGYLVGDTGQWNDAKQAEEKDRVKHI